jgi:hypothetical protein
MEQPITIAQAHIQKQDFRFARYLKASMREETVAYVGQLIADNRPAAELIVSDWTMMNDILAIHYGYAGIEGGALRKVTLRANDPRGGGVMGTPASSRCSPGWATTGSSTAARGLCGTFWTCPRPRRRLRCPN